MCGLGVYVLREARERTDELSLLLDGNRERGPDDEGAVLIDRSSGSLTLLSTPRSVPTARERDASLANARSRHDVAFAHARYAVIDLSEAAHQPFVSGDGSIVGVLNGELYNHLELRAELQGAGHVMRTASDTEVLVEGFRRWKHELWRRLNGFWAAFLYDASDGSVIVSRDRLGVAPLYLRETRAGLYFSSRIRPLLAVEPRASAVDEGAIREFIETGVKDHGDGTFYCDVKSFPAASVMTIPGRDRLGPIVHRYWSFPGDRMRASDIGLEEAARELHQRLVRSVELRLRSDVRVAFELSGGLDSSSIVAAAAELGVRPSTFTISVPERNEVPWAQAVARHFGLSHTILEACEDEVVADAPVLSRIMEEPYHSPNVHTSWKMRREIKAQGNAVVVSGAGGDEVLGGYEHEFWDAARSALWDEGARWHAVRHGFMHRTGSWARARHSWHETIGTARRVARAAVGSGQPVQLEGGEASAIRSRPPAQLMSFHERVRYHCEVSQLPYYLRNGDHLTMSIPLEHRFPFLDFELVGFAARLPVAHLYARGWTKFALRHAFRRDLPPDVVWRREKSGFPFPLGRFLTRNEERLTAPARAGSTFLGSGDRPFDYAALRRHDPLRLWRLCSTGFWMESA
jgi:asparagine synthase (glutamine-hydrolysing)